MKKQVVLVGLCLALAGCGSIGGILPKPAPGANGDSDQTRPQARPGALDVSARTPPPTARTVEEFDTTTREERVAAAAAPEPAGEQRLGTTVASLGDVSRPGFWIETPLVSAPGKGRVQYPGTGKSSAVDLIPIDGPPTGGSRLSLAAMRLIGAPLTELPEVVVFSGG